MELDFSQNSKNIEVGSNFIKIILEEFPTHVQTAKARKAKYKYENVLDEETGRIVKRKVLQNKNTVGKPRFVKINGQILHKHHGQDYISIIVNDYIKKYLDSEVKFKLGEYKVNQYPVKIYYEYHVPYNYASISIRNGKYCIPKEKKTKSKFDLDNLAGFWEKRIQDFLTLKKIIEDDSVEFVEEINKKFIPCNEFENRKIIVYVKW